MDSLPNLLHSNLTKFPYLRNNLMNYYPQIPIYGSHLVGLVELFSKLEILSSLSRGFSDVSFEYGFDQYLVTLSKNVLNLDPQWLAFIGSLNFIIIKCIMVTQIMPFHSHLNQFGVQNRP